MNPEFGTNLRKSVFEVYNGDLETQLRGEIIQAIQTYIPYVDVESIKLSWDESLKTMGRNQVYVSVRFSISDDATGTQILEIVV